MSSPVLSLVFALAADAVSDGDPSWHTICTIGKVKNKPLVGKAIEITTAMADRWIAAFKRRGKEVPADLHHATLMAAVKDDPRWLDPALSSARCWYLDLRREGNDLQALIRWTKEGAALVRDGAFRFFSVEIGQPGDLNEETITGGTLTNKPAANVPAIAFTEAAYEALTAHAGGAIPEPSEYPSADSPPVTTEEIPMSDEIKALADKLGCSVEEVAGKVTALTADADAREAKVTALQTQITALQDSEFTRIVNADLLVPGKIKNEAVALSALRTVYDADRDGFTALCDAIQGQAVPTGEPKGKETPDESTQRDDAPADAQGIADKLHALAEKAITDGKAEDYPAAFTLVCQDNPKLAAAYLPPVEEV